MSSNAGGHATRGHVAPSFSTVTDGGGNDLNGILSLDDIFDSGEIPEGIVPGASLLNKRKGAAAGAKTTEYGSDDFDDFEESASDRKRLRGTHRNMSEEQKVERRERNREHAKRSRVRKKFLLESLQQSVQTLQDENEKLKMAIREHVPTEAEALLQKCVGDESSVIATNTDAATKTLDDPDYSLVKALQTAQQNFVISDPSLPDNPIVYASAGFLVLTGYKLDQVLGRNCRFLQGPATDPKAVDRIRSGIEIGEDTTVCLMNYRADGSTFWNQFFVAALRDGDGNIVNYLGVQCKVSEDYAIAFKQNDGFSGDMLKEKSK